MYAKKSLNILECAGNFRELLPANRHHEIQET